MNDSGFGWESLLCTQGGGRKLKAALFTTYDRAEERLLAEHLLPMLLNLNHESQAERVERQYFLVELHERLKELHDKLIVVSSMAREGSEEAESNGEGETGAYPWIWRSIRSLAVGKTGKAVQHAKLWLLHWGADDKGIEHLEIVVSSANLTRAAFRGQVQAAWRTCVELRPQRSEERLKGWGILPAFLRKLAESAGDEGRLTLFVDLLARADCPEGVQFVASAPGTYSPAELRSTPWGAAGLARIIPSSRGAVSVSILSPFVGSWGTEALERWCARFEGRSKSLSLIWIDKNHPWSPRWVLPRGTLTSLTGAGARLLRLRHETDGNKRTDTFHKEHRPADDRWSHAKAYSFRRGNARKLLVTSANFSPAAWGREGADGKLTMENFELGVCIGQGMWPFENLEVLDLKNAATVQELPNYGISAIAWAQAAWDGKKVRVDCRSGSDKKPAGEVKGKVKCVPFNIGIVEGGGSVRSASVPWADVEDPPSLVRLVCDGRTITVAVFDERSPLERKDDLPPEVDKDLGQTMRDELLFEQYGGQIADGLGDQGVATGETGEEPPTGLESYDVPAFVAARRHLSVVDNWAEREAKRVKGTFEGQMLRRDGVSLMEAFQRQAARDEKQSPGHAIGAGMAAEEMSVRLKHFPEE